MKGYDNVTCNLQLYLKPSLFVSLVSSPGGNGPCQTKIVTFRAQDPLESQPPFDLTNQWG